MKNNKKNFRVIQKRVKGKKNRRRTWTAMALCATVVLGCVIMMFIYGRQTFQRAEIIGSYDKASSSSGNYVAYADGILRYSRDGVALFSIEGEELWNQPCQIQTPMIEMNGDTAVLGDKEGTSVLVLEKTGIKGEFQTARPIEQLAVSRQGIVAAVLGDETTPQILCYDAKGNVLIEQKASMLNTGYPLDIAISPDGKTLLVSYLCIKETSVSTDIVYYNFDDKRAEESKYEIARQTYAGQMIPTVTFIDEKTALLVGDKGIYVWDGVEAPRERLQISYDGTAEQVAYNQKYISFVANNAKTGKRELRAYNRKGQEMFVKEVETEYAHMEMSMQDIIMYEENRCLITNVRGVEKYNGELDVNIEAIARVGALMRYVVADDSGLYRIQLKK